MNWVPIFSSLGYESSNVMFLNFTSFEIQVSGIQLNQFNWELDFSMNIHVFHENRCMRIRLWKRNGFFTLICLSGTAVHMRILTDRLIAKSSLHSEGSALVFIFFIIIRMLILSRNSIWIHCNLECKPHCPNPPICNPSFQHTNSERKPYLCAMPERCVISSEDVRAAQATEARAAPPTRVHANDKGPRRAGDRGPRWRQRSALAQQKHGVMSCQS